MPRPALRRRRAARSSASPSGHTGTFYDVAAALANSRQLDRLDGAATSSNVGAGVTEESSAAWLDDTRVLISGGNEEEDRAEATSFGDLLRLRPRGLAVFDVVARCYLSAVVLDEPAGTLMPVDDDCAVAFYRRPRLVSLRTGEVLQSWDGIDSGRQTSSILGRVPPPSIALDRAHRRFAVTGPDVIHVVELDEDGPT